MYRYLEPRQYEKIENEFMLMESSHSSCYREVKELLQIYSDDICDTLIGIDRELQRCNLEWGLQKLFNKIFGFLGEEELSYFDTEMRLLLKRRVVAEKFGGFYKTLDNIITEDNCSEVGFLGEFTNKKFLSNISYLDGLYRGNDLISMGISYNANGNEDWVVFEEFFLEQVDNISKGKVKVKKDE